MQHHCASVASMATQGMECIDIEIEVHTGSGIPNTIIVGLPDAAVNEARDRIRSAFLNQGLQYPRKRVTINLAPAHVRKSGTLYDVPLALGILQSEQQITCDERFMSVGELALDGRVRAAPGALVIAEASLQKGRKVIVPFANASEVSLLNSEDIFLAENLRQIVEHFRGGQSLPSIREWNKQQKGERANKESTAELLNTVPRLEEIVGQHAAKRALLIAASGGHNILLSGLPGTGKTMLARALQGILPEMQTQELLEVLKVYSLHEPGSASAAMPRPFRSPHHASSAAAILGGGAQLRPGELALAHNGVLFLDEFPEFRRDVLESLREPLESGEIQVTRATGSARYPCRAIVVAAMNPCPCGMAQNSIVTSVSSRSRCTCSPIAIDRYQRKLSGPLLDRFDIKIVVEPVGKSASQSTNVDGELTTEYAQQMIQRARAMAYHRQGVLNAYLSHRQIEEYCSVQDDARELIDQALERGLLSLRGRSKLLKVARTIADLESIHTKNKKVSDAPISRQHIAEALGITQRPQ